MSFFDVLILDIILIIFPIMAVLLGKANLKNIGDIKNNNLIDLSNIISLLLLIKYWDTSNHYLLILVNIPLIISLINNRKLASILIAIVLITFNIYCGYNDLYTLIEYSLYILIFVYLIPKNKTYAKIIFPFILIKGSFLTIYEFYILGNDTLSSLAKVFISLTIFYLVGALTVNITDLIEQMVSLNRTLIELEKEKKLKNALFKLTHEIKNPIAVCKGYMSMMNYNNIKKVESYNKIIASELDRTLQVIESFNNYTKIKVNLDIMDLDMLIKETIKSMEMLFNSKNITVYYDEKDEILINGDYNRLRQVLVNLLKNSVEAIKHDGTIKIKCIKEKNKIKLSIKDNGEGMTEEELRKMDELFYTKKETGSGIGVSLSKEIIKLHNGKIEYESIVNKCTKIIVTLPKVNGLH